MTKRDVIGRYRGSAMGILWSFLNPILMLMVYTFVFNVVLRARWGGENVTKTEFAVVVFVTGRVAKTRSATSLLPLGKVVPVAGKTARPT